MLGRGWWLGGSPRSGPRTAKSPVWEVHKSRYVQISCDARQRKPSGFPALRRSRDRQPRFRANVETFGTRNGGYSSLCPLLVVAVCERYITNRYR